MDAGGANAYDFTAIGQGKIPVTRALPSSGGDDFAEQRIDKWLWAARFFKTRSLAAEAVSGGKVQVGDSRVKPSRRIRAGDRVHIRRGASEWTVTVLGLSLQRRPAREAGLLYQETPESEARRTGEAERARQAAARRARGIGRPTKRDRRELDRLKRREDA